MKIVNANWKKIIQLIIASLLVMLSVNPMLAQSNMNTVNKNIYLGLGLGINDNGFGAVMEIPFSNHISGFGNVGIGGWGYKIGGGIIFYPKQTPYGSGFSIGYSLATGLDDFETELYVEPDDESQSVMLDLNNAATINIMYSYNWTLGNSGKFALCAGYAIPLLSKSYELKDSDVELNEMSEQVLQIMQPGGIIIGFKFMFGI